MSPETVSMSDTLSAPTTVSSVYPGLAFSDKIVFERIIIVSTLVIKTKDKENYEDCRPWNEMNHLFKTVRVFIGKKNSPFVDKGGFFP